MKQYAKEVQERQQNQVTKKANVLQARALVLPNSEFKDKGHVTAGIKTFNKNRIFRRLNIHLGRGYSI